MPIPQTRVGLEQSKTTHRGDTSPAKSDMKRKAFARCNDQAMFTGGTIMKSTNTYLHGAIVSLLIAIHVNLSAAANRVV